MMSSPSDHFHIFHASKGLAKGTDAGGGAVTLESTEIERKREDWQGRVSALVLPFCGCFLVMLKMNSVPS